MNTDDFEKKLQRQPMREIPGDWREAILQNARANAPAAPARQAPLFVRAGATLWRELFWPCRHVWSGLAAAWLVVVLVNARPGDASPLPTTMATATPAEKIRLFEEQRRVLVELTGPLELPPVESSQRPRPRPHSQRMLA